MDNHIEINGNVNNACIQQGTTDSSQFQSNSSNLDFESVLKLIADIENNIGNISIEAGLMPQVIEDISVIKSMAIAKKDPVTIKSRLGSLRRIFEGATGSLLATFIQSITSIIGA
jgi:hypothetical protein